MRTLKRIKTKLKSQKGASITFALLLFLVCAVVGSVVLTAGTAAAGRMSEMARMDQRYYSVTSAAQLLRDTIDGQTVTVQSVSVNGAAPQPGTPELSDVESPILKDAAAQLTGTGGIGTGISADVSRTWTLTGDGEIENAALDVRIAETLQPDGTMIMLISNTTGSGSVGTSGAGYVYTLRLRFDADLKQTEDVRTEESVDVVSRNTVATKTVTTTTTITWRFADIGKVTAEPATTGGSGS